MSDSIQSKSMFDIVPASMSRDEQRLRERYISQRFPQLADPATDLRRTGDVLTWAQQSIEDGRKSQAIELLTLALQEDVTQRAIWLFLIEDAFLQDDAERFAQLATEFKQQFAGDAAQVLIDAMAHDLAPAALPVAGATPPAAPMALPMWSGGAAERDADLQNKLHAALQQVVASYRAG
jgi:hypothetical protein